MKKEILTVLASGAVAAGSTALVINHSAPTVPQPIVAEAPVSTQNIELPKSEELSVESPKPLEPVAEPVEDVIVDEASDDSDLVEALLDVADPEILPNVEALPEEDIFEQPETVLTPEEELALGINLDSDTEPVFVDDFYEATTPTSEDLEGADSAEADKPVISAKAQEYLDLAVQAAADADSGDGVSYEATLNAQEYFKLYEAELEK